MAKIKCDAVVIGSGIGGMCAAARLSYAGYKTVLLEKTAKLGGRYTTVQYKGYRIPTGAVIVIHPENGPVVQTLENVGTHVDIIIPKLNWAYWIDGKVHHQPEKGGLWWQIETAARNKSEEERVKEALRKAVYWQEPTDFVSFREWLFHYTDNPLIHGIFKKMCYGQLTSWTHEVPAGEYIRILKNYRKFGHAYGMPRGGLTDIINALAKVVEDKGGRILTKTPARKIVVTEGVTRGVIAEKDGEKLEIECRVVVSNAGPHATIELTGKEHFDRCYLRDVNTNVIPTRTINMYWTSDRPILGDYPGWIQFPRTEIFRVALDMSVTWPECSPKGKHLTYLCLGVKGERLQDTVDLAMQEIKECLPELTQYGKLLLLKSFHGDWPANRAHQGYDITQKVPSIENLYNVGDGVKPRGYSMGDGCAESARIVVEDIKNRIAAG